MKAFKRQRALIPFVVLLGFVNAGAALAFTKPRRTTRRESALTFKGFHLFLHLAHNDGPHKQRD